MSFLRTHFLRLQIHFGNQLGIQPVPGGSSVPPLTACRLPYTQLIFSRRERLIIFKKFE